jgi:hypothetical protein
VIENNTADEAGLGKPKKQLSARQEKESFGRRHESNDVTSLRE